MYGNGDRCRHRTCRSIGWVIVSKVAKVSFIRFINISLDIEIFKNLFNELLYQKVARLLNEQVMIVFTTQVVKYGQKGINISKRGQKGSTGQGSILNRILFMIRSNKNPIKSALSVS